MEYGKILNRSVNIVWQNKFLIVLGILAALGSGSFGGGGGGGGGDGCGQSFGDPGQFPEFGEEIAALAIGVDCCPGLRGPIGRYRALGHFHHCPWRPDRQRR